MSTAPSETKFRILDQAAIGLLMAGLLARIMVAGANPAWGTNLLIHAIPWIAAALWCIERITQGRTPMRLTGLEGAVAAWIILCIVSIQRSPHKLGAIDTAVAFATGAALIPIIIHVAGPDRRSLLAAFLHAGCFAIGLYAIFQVYVLLPMLRDSDEARAFIAKLGDDQNEFVIRLMGSQPWGTFISPNTLAGFLVLAIPFAAGAAVDAKANKPVLLIRLAAVILGLIALILTGSKGGWGALGMAAAGAVLLMLAQARPAHRRTILTIGLTLAVVALALGWYVTSTRVKSMEFRAAYATSAIKAWETSPALGIGLGQFEDAFPRYKTELQQETRKVHNDYVQILTELGVVGLLVFLALIGFTFRHALSATPATPSTSPPSLIAPVAGAVLAVCVTAAFTGDLWLAAGVGLPFIAAFWLNANHEPGEFARLGLTAGFIGLLAHLAVDFDFYEYGMTWIFFFAAALLILLSRDLPETEGGVLAGAGGTAIALIAAIPIAWGGSRFLSAEGYLASAAPHPETRERELVAAWDHNPLDSATAATLAQHYMVAWRGLARRDDYSAKGIQDLQAVEQAVMEMFNHAIARRPNLVAWYRMRGLAWQEIARFYRTAAQKTGNPTFASLARPHLASAKNDLAKVIELYPTRATSHVSMARLLDEEGQEAAALPYYEEALRLSGKAFDTGRLQLSFIDHARALSRLGKPTDAVEPMKRHIDARIEEQFRRTGRKMIPEELLKVIDDWRTDPAKHIDEAWHPSMQSALDRASFELMEKVKQNADQMQKHPKQP